MEGARSEDVDVAFDGAPAGGEDVDGEGGVVAGGCSGFDRCIRDGSGRGEADDGGEGGEHSDLHFG